MPMYQYACKECGQNFEKKLRMAEASDPQVCPACGSGQTRKRIGAIAVGGSSKSMAAAMPAPPPSSPFT